MRVSPDSSKVTAIILWSSSFHEATQVSGLWTEPGVTVPTQLEHCVQEARTASWGGTFQVPLTTHSLSPQISALGIRGREDMSDGLLCGSQVRTRAPAGSCWDPDKSWDIEQVWIQQYGRGWLRE